MAFVADWCGSWVAGRQGPWLVLAVLMLVGCNGAAAPHAEVLAATAAVREAEALHAATLAADAMARASSKLEAAKAALDVSAHGYARRSAEQSAVDAELAATQARARVARDTADELRAQVEHLRATMTPRMARSGIWGPQCRRQPWALNAYCR